MLLVALTGEHLCNPEIKLKGNLEPVLLAEFVKESSVPDLTCSETESRCSFVILNLQFLNKRS